MDKFKKRIQGLKVADQQEKQFKFNMKNFKGDEYLSKYNQEKFHFLNNSRRLMPNGNTSAHMPCNAASRTEIKLYETIKEAMDSEQHRKLQFQIRGANDYWSDRLEQTDQQVRRQRALRKEREEMRRK